MLGRRRDALCVSLPSSGTRRVHTQIVRGARGRRVHNMQDVDSKRSSDFDRDTEAVAAGMDEHFDIDDSSPHIRCGFWRMVSLCNHERGHLHHVGLLSHCSLRRIRVAYLPGVLERSRRELVRRSHASGRHSDDSSRVDSVRRAERLKLEFAPTYERTANHLCDSSIYPRDGVL